MGGWGMLRGGGESVRGEGFDGDGNGNGECEGEWSTVASAPYPALSCPILPCPALHPYILTMIYL